MKKKNLVILQESLVREEKVTSACRTFPSITEPAENPVRDAGIMKTYFVALINYPVLYLLEYCSKL